MPSILPDYVNNAQNAVTNAGQTLQGYAGREYTIGEELKKVLDEATTPGKTDWANIRSTALSDYLAAPDQARNMYRNPESEQYIFNPAQSKAAMTEYVQGSEVPFLTANTLFSMFTDQEKDLIESGTNAFKAQQAAAQAAYDAAQQTFSNVLSQFNAEEGARAQQEAEKLAREKFDFDKIQANKKSGSGGVDMASILASILGTGGGGRDLSTLDKAVEEDKKNLNTQQGGSDFLKSMGWYSPVGNNNQQPLLQSGGQGAYIQSPSFGNLSTKGLKI